MPIEPSPIFFWPVRIGQVLVLHRINLQVLPKIDDRTYAGLKIFCRSDSEALNNFTGRNLPAWLL
ncbi:MAG: hypothetical protein ACI9JM_000395 [Halioglobus sp.]|jgi:hypothetical protein